MNKEQRDKLREILEFHPGDIVPVPGTTQDIIDLLDQIDYLERELELWEAFRRDLSRAIIP